MLSKINQAYKNQSLARLLAKDLVIYNFRKTENLTALIRAWTIHLSRDMPELSIMILLAPGMG